MSLNSFYVMSLSLTTKRCYFDLANDRSLSSYGSAQLLISGKNHRWTVPRDHQSTTDELLESLACFKGENLLAEGASPILRERLKLVQSNGCQSDESYYQHLRGAVRPLAKAWFDEFAPGAELGTLAVRKESTSRAVYRLSATTVVSLAPNLRVWARLVFAPDPNHENAWGIRPEISVSEQHFDQVQDRTDNANRIMQSQFNVRPLWVN